MNENCIFLKNSSYENFKIPIRDRKFNLLVFSMEIREAHGSYCLSRPWWSPHEWQRCSCKGWVRQRLDFYLKLYHTAMRGSEYNYRSEAMSQLCNHDTAKYLSLFLSMHMTDHLQALVHLVRICLMLQKIKKRTVIQHVPIVRPIYDFSVTEIVHFHGRKIFCF